MAVSMKMQTCDIKKAKLYQKGIVRNKSDHVCFRFLRKIMASSVQVTTLLFGLIIGFSLYNICVILLQLMSHRVVTNTYGWYKTTHACIKSTSEQGELIDLAERAATALDRLNIPAPVCYGTLWGVLRYKDVLPWDNNVDFCVLNENLLNVSFSDMQQIFSEEGIVLNDFSYSVGSYRMQRGLVEGHINVFANCTHTVLMFNPELNIRTMPGEEMLHWACAYYSIASVFGKYTHDLNRPFPTWLLTPPFTKGRLAYTYVNIPRGNFEMQRYLYPDDWWLEVKPSGCL